MECRAVINSLSDYLDSQNAPLTVNWISDDEVERIETHLTNCPACQNLKLELSEIKTAARELPLHTPPRAMWTRISNVIEAEISAENAPLHQTQNGSGWWGRLRSRKFTFSLPQMVAGGALAVALIIAGNSGIFVPQSGILDFADVQNALLLPEEGEIKNQLERRMDQVNARKANWDLQRRVEFEQRMIKIDESLNRCRYMLKHNPKDAVHQEMVRALYSEKRQLLEDVERLRW
ncbi:MAG TPA: zf-HC2 domain-containing protein [Blastocatellia bacterium]|nr:zf-HC2 domain-containing protein [Blastocatellia bacterium]